LKKLFPVSFLFRSALLALALSTLTLGAQAQLPEVLPQGDYGEGADKKSKKTESAEKNEKESDEEKSKAEQEFLALRSRAILGAKVWEAPATPIGEVDFSTTPIEANGFPYASELVCKWKPDRGSGGKSRKFRCTLPSGEVLKVKYSIKGKKDNPEVRTETMGSRLLNGVGFASDRMHILNKIRCFGCSLDPFKDDHSTEPQAEPDYTKYTDFDFVSVEKKFDGKEIANDKVSGISIKEIAKIDASQGGSTQKEIDALFLMMAFLNHTDNKADNQQLFCIRAPKSKECAAYRAIVHDSGVIMGGRYRLFERKLILPWPVFASRALNLKEWAKAKIWEDNDSPDCKLGMKADPFMASLKMTISEEGRQMVVSMLRQISDQQIRDLLTGIRLLEFNRLKEEERDLDKWVSLFRERQALIEKKTCR
jgi:hypothetical protein